MYCLKNKTIDPIELIHTTHRRFRENSTAWQAKEAELKLRWIHPPEHVVKINFDVACRQQSAAIAAAGHNSNGDILQVWTCTLPAMTSFWGEAHALQLARQMAREFQ